jgi:phage-related protein
MNQGLKHVEWIGSSKKDILALPVDVKKHLGFALDQAQRGGKHPDAKPLKGFGSAAILEIVDDYDGNTYRGIYTAKFEGFIYVLHVFQKKSKKGISTPKQEIDLVKRRLALAESHYESWKKSV